MVASSALFKSRSGHLPVKMLSLLDLDRMNSVQHEIEPGDILHPVPYFLLLSNLLRISPKTLLLSRRLSC